MTLALKPTPRKRKRWWIVGALALLTVTLIVTRIGVLYRRYTDPVHVRALIQESLGRWTSAAVECGDLQVGFLEGVHLRDVRLSSPDGDAFIRCPEITVRHDPWSALIGRFRALSVTAVSPVVRVIHDDRTAAFNLAGLFARTPSHALENTALPTVELRDARLQIVRRAAGGDRVSDDLTLTIRARPADKRAAAYDIVWQINDDPRDTGHSQLDLQTGELRNLRGGLPSLSLESVLLAVAAGSDPVGAAAESLHLQGRLRARDYHLFGPPGVAATVTFELIDASLSIPVDPDERTMPADARYLRFDAVNGEVEWTSDSLRADFRGRFHGAECSVSATVHGDLAGPTTLNDLAFEADATLAGVPLPSDAPHAPADQIRFLRRWDSVTKFFQDYDPHGPIDLHLVAAKDAGADQHVQLRRARITARGGDASARYYPYRGDELSGGLEFAPDGVWIRHVCGAHAGGTVCVDGRFDRPSSCAPAELRITGVNLPIDQPLNAGLDDRYRRAVEPLNLAGRIGVDLALTRAECVGDQPAEWSWTSTVSLNDVETRHVDFPYPVTNLTGTLQAEGDRVRLVDVTGLAARAQVAITGNVALARGANPLVDLHVNALDAEFDETLYTSLPPNLAEALRRLRLEGRFDLSTDLRTDPQTMTAAAHSRVVLRSARLRPTAFPLTLADVQGTVELSAEGAKFASLTGRYGTATLEASGRCGLSADRPEVDLVVEVRGLEVDETLRAAVSGALRDALTEWQLLTPVDARVRVASAPDDGQWLVQIRADLAGETIRRAGLAVPFTDARGTITLDAHGARGVGLTARYAGADVQADFDTRRTDGVDEGTIVLQVSHLPLDEHLRDALSPATRRAWDAAAPHGQIDARLQELRYRRPSPDAPTTWSVDGRLDLHDVGLSGVAGLEKVSGVVTVSGSPVDALGGVMLGGVIRAPSGKAYQRTFTDSESEWSLARSADGAGRFVLRQARAAAYDGALRGELELNFDAGRADYNATLGIHGVQIQPWLSAGRRAADITEPAADGAKPAGVRGSVDAQLSVSGELGDPSSRRGRGRVEIRRGHIYRLPILLAILNVLQMSPPGDESFHDAQGDFLVLGDRLIFDDLELRGGALTLIGDGSMTLPDQVVDLRLFQAASAGINRVPVLADLVEGASREFVELHVTGPISRPTVRTQSFRGVTEELKKLFQKRTAKPVTPAGP